MPNPARNSAENRGLETSPGVLRAIGGVRLELERHAVVRDGEALRLRPKTADVLAYLAANPDRIVTKAEVIDAVWAGVAVTDDSLVQCLTEIRRALGPWQDRVQTIRGRGYLLTAGTDSAVEPAPATVPTPSGGEGQPAPPPAGPPAVVDTHTRRSPVVRMVLVGGLALVVITGLSLVSARPPRATSLLDSVSPEARAALQEGQAALRESRAQVDLQRARASFERAVAIDPGYAAGHAALANTLVMLSVFGIERPLEVLPEANRAARRAVALDPTHGPGWQALAHVQTQYDRDWEGAARSYQRAVALDPGHVSNAIYGHLLAGVGRFDDALRHSDGMVAAAPTNFQSLASSCLVNYLARRYKDAVAACDRALARAPAPSHAHLFRALALVEMDDMEGAMAAALAAHRDVAFVPTWVIGYVHSRAGRREAAAEVLAAADARAASVYVPAFNMAMLHLAAGATADALTWFERAAEEHSPWVELIGVLPAVDPLRDEPRFQALLDGMRLPNRR